MPKLFCEEFRGNSREQIFHLLPVIVFQSNRANIDFIGLIDDVRQNQFIFV